MTWDIGFRHWFGLFPRLLKDQPLFEPNRKRSKGFLSETRIQTTMDSPCVAFRIPSACARFGGVLKKKQRVVTVRFLGRFEKHVEIP